MRWTELIANNAIVYLVIATNLAAAQTTIRATPEPTPAGSSNLDSTTKTVNGSTSNSKGVERMDICGVHPEFPWCKGLPSN